MCFHVCGCLTLCHSERVCVGFIVIQVAELTAQGLVRESEGAMCFFIPDKSIPLMLRKSDGGFTYDTTDMAAYVTLPVFLCSLVFHTHTHNTDTYSLTNTLKPAVIFCVISLGGAACLSPSSHSSSSSSFSSSSWVNHRNNRIRYRLQTEAADWLIYVTDSGQASHFDMIFCAARMCGYVTVCVSVCVCVCVCVCV